MNPKGRLVSQLLHWVVFSHFLLSSDPPDSLHLPRPSRLSPAATLTQISCKMISRLPGSGSRRPASPLSRCPLPFRHPHAHLPTSYLLSLYLTCMRPLTCNQEPRDWASVYTCSPGDPIQSHGCQRWTFPSFPGTLGWYAHCLLHDFSRGWGAGEIGPSNPYS